MELSTHNLVLDANSPVDMQLHTINSDGTWTPEGLVDYLKAEQFGLVAITDHDRVDHTPLLDLPHERPGGGHAFHDAPPGDRYVRSAEVHKGSAASP